MTDIANEMTEPEGDPHGAYVTIRYSRRKTDQLFRPALSSSKKLSRHDHSEEDCRIIITAKYYERNQSETNKKCTNTA